MTEPPVQKRSIVYVDGFNLYYGAVRHTQHKWLNLELLFTRLRLHDDLQAIRYFTALVTGSHRANQQTYLKALRTLPLVQVILGRFKGKKVTCKVNACTSPPPSREFRIWEEKRTDVNIGIHMLDDAYQDRCDRLILVSGDSDLVPAVHAVKSQFRDKQIIVYVPARNDIRGAATEIREAADKDKTLPNELIRKSQFLAAIPDGNSGTIRKPADW